MKAIVKNTTARKAMKAAWTNWKAGRYTSWSECLKSAWAWAKRTAKKSPFVQSLLNRIAETKNMITKNEYFEGVHNGIVKETAKAYLLSFFSVVKREDVNVWIPKSLVSEISENRAMIKSWYYAKELSWTVK